MEFSSTELALIGVGLAAWTLGAALMILRATGKVRDAENARRAAKRLGRMVDESPAVPLLVRADGKIEAPERLASWLGLDKVPGYLSELDAGSYGIATEQLALLDENVRRAQKTATPFRMVVTPRGTTNSLALHGHLADPLVSPGGAALVWFFDFSDSQSELAKLRSDAARARDDFAALVGLKWTHQGTRHRGRPQDGVTHHNLPTDRNRCQAETGGGSGTKVPPQATAAQHQHR